MRCYLYLIIIIFLSMPALSSAEVFEFKLGYNSVTFNGFSDITLNLDDYKIKKLVEVKDNYFQIDFSEMNINNSSMDVFIRKKNLYYGHINLPYDKSIIPLNPVASLSGYVIDEKNNLIKHATLKFVCNNIGNEYPIETDSLGLFSVPIIGFGKCDILAIYKNHLSQISLNINSSKKYLVSIKIDTRFYPTKSEFFFSITLFILLIIFLVFFLSKKNTRSIFSNYLKKDEKGNEQIILKEREETNRKSKTPLIYTPGQEKIMTTLSERESLIIQEIKIKGPLTQSQLRFYTGLPKSTLHRTISSLERKNILISFEEGGIKRVKLTDFFLDS